MKVVAPMYIETTPAKLGMESRRASISIRQPSADMDFQQPRAQQQIEQPNGVLRVDQEKAWDALGIGSALAFMSRISSQMRQLGLEAIGNIAARGDRLGSIHTRENAIPAMASRWMDPIGHIQLFGEASYDNVDIFYEAQTPVIEAEANKPQTIINKRNPELEYQPWKLDIYMMQYHQVTITPPKIDYTV